MVVHSPGFGIYNYMWLRGRTPARFRQAFSYGGAKF